MVTYNKFKFCIDDLIISFVVSDSRETLYCGDSPVHAHHGFELHYVIEGDMEFEINKSKISAEPGKVYIIAPYNYHSVRVCSEKIKRLSMMFSLKKNKSALTSGGAYDHYFSIYSSIDGIAAVQPAGIYADDMFECVRNFVESGKLDVEMFESLFLVLFKKIGSCLSGKSCYYYSLAGNKPESEAQEVMRALETEEFIERHYKEDVCVDDLANYLHLSSRQTNRFLREYMDITFNDFIRKYRIELAKTLLLKYNMTASEVADSVGYKSYNGFLDAFRSETGYTPTAYISQNT